MPFVFLILPVLEIMTFVLIGSKIGVLATIALVVVTAVAGATLMRIQGISTLSNIRRAMERGDMPDRELIHGAMILLAGILLMTPGFITDTLGLLLFVPVTRDRAWGLIRRRVVAFAAASGPGSYQCRERAARTIDLQAGDFSRADPRD